MSIINQALKKTQEALEEKTKLKETPTLETNTQFNSQIIANAQKKTVRQKLKQTIHQTQTAALKEKIIEKKPVPSQNPIVLPDQNNKSQLDDTKNTIIEKNQHAKKQRKTRNPTTIESEKAQSKSIEEPNADKNLRVSFSIKSKKITIFISSIFLLTMTYLFSTLIYNKTQFFNSLPHNAKNSQLSSTLLTENASIPTLDGTILMDNDSVAVIDHHTMHIGEELDGYKVAQIHLNDVLLENLHTHEYVTVKPKLNS